MTLPLVLGTSQAQSALAAQSSSAGNAADIAEADITRLKPIDLRSAEAFAAGHLPGAVRLDAALLNRKEDGKAGLLPKPAVVNAFLSASGLNLGDHVLAYDAGAATEAARLIWVLHAYGFVHASWLDGGFSAWQADGLPTSTEAVSPSPGTLSTAFKGENVVTAETLMTELADSSPTILDVRSAAEFEGSDVRSARGGHVPGATHLEWTRVFDSNGRLLDDAALRDLFGREATSSDDVIVYCQSHQRSAVTYVVLKHLGVDQIRAIDGAWSSWGNRDDTPVETGL